MSDLAQAIRESINAQLKRASLDPRVLDKPGAHVVVPGEISEPGDNGKRQGELHVLVKKGTGLAAEDTLEAQIRGAGNARRTLDVTPGDTLDLGELGEWQSFAISGIDLDGPTTASGQPLNLQVVSAATQSQEPGAQFFASMDLGFAIQQVIAQGQLALRPIPPGERDGKSFVSVTPQMRDLLVRLLGRSVDETIPAEELGEALQAWNNLQGHVASAGLLGAAIATGQVPTQIEVPRPFVTPAAPSEDQAKASGQLSDETLKALEQLHVSVPEGGPTLQWCEETLDRLPSDTPAAVARDVRELFATLQEQDSTVVDDLFGDIASEAAPKNPSVHAGDSRLAQSREYKIAQLSEGLAGLGVSPDTVRHLAHLMATSLQPSSKPSVVIFTGPKHSSADRFLELATSMVGSNPLVLGREDLSEPGFPAVYGAIRGAVPTGADALLSREVLDAHRDGVARHVPVVVEDLTAAGSAADTDTEQTAALKDWLERIAELTQTGTINTFAKGNGRSSEIQEVSLANTVFLMRWDRDPQELQAILASDADLAGLSTRIVHSQGFEPEEGVTFLEQELRFGLLQAGLPKDIEVSFSNELRSAFRAMYATLGPQQAFETLRERLLTEVGDAITSSPPTTALEIGWSRRLTPGERNKICKGESVAFASRFFSVSAVEGESSHALRFGANWEDVVQRAQRVPELEREVNRLRALVASAQGSDNTV